MNKAYELHIENFSGPLDVLLELVKEKKMDIFNINLFELASAYVELIKGMKNKNIDLASEYLVMAATLIHLKAKLLLENPKEQESAVKEQKNLLKQLTEYHQFKQVAASLRTKETERQNIFIKEPEDYKQFQFTIDESQLDGKSDVLSIVINLRKMFERTNSVKLRQAQIATFNFSPAERREEIINLIKDKEKISFDAIFSVPTINHFVVTVLTVLDMARRNELLLEQSSQFGDIKITRGEIENE